MKEIVNKAYEVFETLKNYVLFDSSKEKLYGGEIPLPLSSEKVRFQRSSAGTWFSSLIKEALSIQVVLLEGGTIRANATYPEAFTFRDLQKELPFKDLVVIVPMFGRDLEKLIQIENWRGVENSRFWQMDYGVVVDEKEKKLLKVNSEDFDPTEIYQVGILDYALKNPRDNEILLKFQPIMNNSHHWKCRSEFCQISFELALRSLVSHRFLEILTASFTSLDKDHNNILDFQEINAEVKNPTITAQIMKQLDTNGDGVISPDEYDAIKNL